MNLQTLIPIVLKASVSLSVFAIGLKASPNDATYMLRRPSQLVRTLLAMNILMPAFAVALVWILHMNPAVEIALVMLAVSPIPPLLPGKLTKAGGTDSYALGLLIAAGLLSIVFVPLTMEILQRVFDIPLRMSSMSVAALVFKTILLPIGLGVLGHQVLRGSAERLAGLIAKVAAIGLLACVVAILIAVAPAIRTLIGGSTLIAIAAFVLVGLAIGHLLGGPEPENRSSLAIATSSRHPGIAIALATANFPEQKLAMAAVLLYLLVNALVSAPYLGWIKRRMPNATA